MKRLLACCLFIVMIAFCAPLHALLPAAHAEQQDAPDEIKLLRYAQALYDDMIIGHPTAQQYRIYQWERKDFFRDRLAKAKAYNFTYDYFINISSALLDIGIGFLTGDAGRMLGGVGGMYLDAAYDEVLKQLKLTAPMSVKDYIYAQAASAYNAIELGTIENVMERAQNNGGKLVSYADAVELVYCHLRNELNFSTLSLASAYYDKQLNEGINGAIRDLTVKISLSEIAGKAANNFVMSTLEDYLLGFEYEFLDGIGQQANEPCVNQWIREQKTILAEMSRFCGSGEDVVGLKDSSHPSWISEDAGKWTSVSGEACEMEIQPLGGVSRMQLYFPGTGRTETAVFAGIDSRHRAVYLDAENAAVITYSGTGNEINLWINIYGGNSFGGSRDDRTATFVRQEYAWAGRWVNTENSETVLDITSNGDGTLHMKAHFDPDVDASCNFVPSDYEIIYFEEPDGDFCGGDMRIDGETGQLELFIPTDFLDSTSPLYRYIENHGTNYYFTTEPPPDLGRYGWKPHDDYDGYEEEIALTDEDIRQLFETLSETPLIACAGAGAWEGQLKINADGSFTGYYYDADAGDEVVYEVSFFGSFDLSCVEKWGSGGSYGLWLGSVGTRQVPGTEAYTDYGDRIIYDEAPFKGEEYLYLTMPGTDSGAVPEMVQMEIGGTLDEWEDYSRFITLTRMDDGWGFFADPADPPKYDPEPLATKAPSDPIPAPEASEQLPENVTWLPEGNLRYDDGLIAFEIPDGPDVTTSGKFTSEGLYWLNTVNIWKPGTVDGIYSLGVSEVPEGQNAEEMAWTIMPRELPYESYETVAGRTARCIQTNPLDEDHSAMYFYIPLSGNRLLYISRGFCNDAEDKNSWELFLSTLEIRDSLYAVPPEDQAEAPTVTQAPPVITPAEDPAPAYLADGWTGYWMTHDDSLAEMIITDNGSGTLHARTMFLPAADYEATLTPQADGSMRFEDQYGYLIGQMTRLEDGRLYLSFTGGSTMEEDEATEYQDYYARGFTYSPAVYEEMWYQTPSDAAGSDDDWLGHWTAVTANGTSTLHFFREGGEMRLDVTIGQYHFSGSPEKSGDTVMDLFGDDFSCMLVLNRKLNKIAMMEVGSGIEEVYDLTGNPYYGVIMFQKDSDYSISVTPDQLDAISDVEVPPVLTLPVLTQAPQESALLQIPGKTGYMQVPVKNVDATSYIVGKNDPTAYAPFRMTDGEETTSFQFSTKTTRLGEAYLYFDFNSPVTLDEMWLKNGFWKIADGKDQYTRNSRIKKMTIFVRCAGDSDYQMLKDVTLKDDSARKDWKVISMLGVQNVIGVRIRIDEIYKGSKFPNDVCVSEIMFVQADARY